MQFKPFGKRYSFSKEVLIRDFPGYMQEPIRNWFFSTLEYTDVLELEYNGHSYYLKDYFKDNLQLHFREEFPKKWNSFVDFVLFDSDRTANFIALCLQNYAMASDALSLELVLLQGGSAFGVKKINPSADEYKRGVYDLIERVSPIVREQSESAIESNQLLNDAWIYCYSRNPDYEKVVTKACDFLESFLGKKYFPKDTKPQLKKFVHAFELTPGILDYKGNSIVNPKNRLTDLLEEASNIRGQHTGGQGRVPTKEEAEFVLHTTILIWNLHQK